MKRFLYILPAILSTFVSSAHTNGELYVSEMTCEYLTNPLSVYSPTPRLAWKIVTKQENAHNIKQSAYQIQVSKSPENLYNGIADLWDSGKVESETPIQIKYNGNKLQNGERCYWRVRVWTNDGKVTDWSDIACWSHAIDAFDTEWIGDKTDTDLHNYLEYVYSGYPNDSFDELKWKTPPTLSSPLLRKDFDVDDGISNATLYVSALGYYELWLNGNRIGENILSPEWTDYNQRLQYQTYNVTDLIKTGDNAICATMADGWALGRLAGIKWMKNFPHRGFYATDRRLIAKLVIEYDNGDILEIPTDSSWKINPHGYILEADNFAGETIDARNLDISWTKPGYDVSKWDNASVDSTVHRNLVPQVNEPIQIHTTLSPVRIWKRGDKYMVDFGQNIAGFCKLKIKGKKGSVITLRHGEWLNNDGTLYTQSLGYANATDRFILSGKDDVFIPSMTYHGFQYVELNGVEELHQNQIEAMAISSSANVTGQFKCSNPDLNKLFDNILWTQRNNMLSVITDNPSRDERTGAMGDIQIFAQTSIFNMNMAAFYTKYIYDMKTVADNGQFFSMVPSLKNGAFWGGWVGAPGWCEAAFIIPWRLYENYGDVNGFIQLYDEMKRHIDVTLQENPDLIWRVRHNHNGDWLNANNISSTLDSTYNTHNGATPDDLFATAFLRHSTQLLANTATLLNRPTDYVKYNDLSQKIKDKFADNFIDKNGKIDGDSQGTYSLALYYNMVPDSMRQICFNHLLDCIADYDYRLSTGFITTPMMMQLLSDFGRYDIAYRLLTSTRFPSWLYIVRNGASTIWERWDAWTPEKGFQNPTMNSLDHVAFGAVGEWMYRNILGINPDVTNPGYRHFFLKPIIGGNLTWAEGSYDSIRGKIQSSWKIDGHEVIYSFTIPANSTATVILQADEDQYISGEYSEHFTRTSPGELSAELGSGTYCFHIK